MILLRADGSKEIGMGHLSRAVLLSNKLKEILGVQAKLILKKDVAAIKFLERRDVECFFLKNNFNFLQEADAVISIAKENKANLIILDLLEQDVDKEYMLTIRSSGISVLAVTDDSHKRVIDADNIINGNPNQIFIDYSKEKGQYYVGPKYFIMDPSYAKIKPRTINNDVKKVLLTLGGSDHNDIMFKVLDAIQCINEKIKLLIVVSEACGYLSRLNDFLTDYPLDYELFMDINGLQDLWGQVDFGITAGGNSLFERIASRVPGATVCQLMRQMEIADSFERCAVNVNLGFGPDLTAEELKLKLIDFFKDKENHFVQYKNASSVIDGKGLLRIVQLIENIIAR